MKPLNLKLITFTLLFGMFINPIFSQDIYYVENEKLDKSEYLNFENNTINFDVSSFEVGFKFSDNTFEKLGKSWSPQLVVRGNDNMFMVMKYYTSGKFDKIVFVKGEYSDLVNEIEEDKIGTKTTILKTIKPEGYGQLKYPNFISKYSLESKIKKLNEDKVRIDNYNSQTKLKDYIGTYKVKFTFHSNYTVSSTGTIYVTNEGVTIKCEDIISLNLLRSSHNKTYPKDKLGKTWDEGSFYCKITKGYGGDLMITINKESKSVGLTTGSGSTSKTTSGTIIEFIP